MDRKTLDNYLFSFGREVHRTYSEETRYYIDEHGQRHTKSTKITKVCFFDQGHDTTDRSPQVAAPIGGSLKHLGNSGLRLWKRHHLYEFGGSSNWSEGSRTSLASIDSGYNICKGSFQEPVYKARVRLFSRTGDGWLRVVTDESQDRYYLDTKGRKSDPNSRFIWADDSRGRGMALAVEIPNNSEPKCLCISYNRDRSLKLVPCVLNEGSANVPDESCIFKSSITTDCVSRKIARFRAVYGPKVELHDVYLGASGPDDHAKLCEQFVRNDGSPAGTNPETCFTMIDCA